MPIDAGDRGQPLLGGDTKPDGTVCGPESIIGRRLRQAEQDHRAIALKADDGFPA